MNHQSYKKSDESSELQEEWSTRWEFTVVENKTHMHMFLVLGPSCWRRFPAACIAGYEPWNQSVILLATDTICDRRVTQSAIPGPPLIPNTMAKPCVLLCAQNGSKAKALRCKDFGAAEFFRKFCARHSLLKINTGHCVKIHAFCNMW